MKTKKFYYIFVFLVIACMLFTSVTHASFIVALNVNSVNLSIASRTQEYSIPFQVDNKEVYVRQSFSNGQFPDVENLLHTSDIGDNFKVTDSGLYINDTDETSSSWVFVKFLNEDGYSSELNENHTYYTCAEIMVESLESGFFSFALSNSFHLLDTGTIKSFGVSTQTAHVNSSTNGEYVKRSIYGKITKHDTYNDATNNLIYSPDYPDALQFGMPATAIGTAYIKNVMMLDLTEIFGTGNEPPQSWCDENITIETAEVTWLVNLS